MPLAGPAGEQVDRVSQVSRVDRANRVDPYDVLKRKAAAQEALPSFPLDGVKITFDIDADYQVVRTQLTHNVIATIESSGPQLKSSDHYSSRREPRSCPRP